MTPLQLELMMVRRIIGDLSREERRLVAEVAADCDHPIVVDYQWEHDNGYGRQKMITGEQCTLCGAKRPWKATWPFDRRRDE
jgi:hypothetical protein